MQADARMDSLQSKTVALTGFLRDHSALLPADLLWSSRGIPAADVSVRESGGLSQTQSEIDSRIAFAKHVRVVDVDGFMLGVPGEEWRLAAFLSRKGVPEPGVVKLFSRIVKPGMTVVDVGASLGLYTLYAARLLSGQGRIHSFEPAPDTYQILRANVQLDGFLESGIVSFHPEAVSDRRGVAPLMIFPGDGGHNTLFWDNVETYGLPVNTTNLDAALAGEARIDVVKIDAEGSEPTILRGMRRIIQANPQIRIIMEFAPAH